MLVIVRQLFRSASVGRAGHHAVVVDTVKTIPAMVDALIERVSTGEFDSQLVGPTPNKKGEEDRDGRATSGVQAGTAGRHQDHKVTPPIWHEGASGDRGPFLMCAVAVHQQGACISPEPTLYHSKTGVVASGR